MASRALRQALPSEQGIVFGLGLEALATMALALDALAHLTTRDVATVLERTRDRIKKYLSRQRFLQEDDDPEDASDKDGLAVLAASAVSGAAPPAGPEWRRGALPFASRPMAFERPQCVALDGFTLHAATRAGGLDEQGREALLKYILRPAVAQERVSRGPDSLVRIALKKPFSDGTVAVDLDPLSLLCRLAASVPAPRFHTTRYAGVLLRRPQRPRRPRGTRSWPTRRDEAPTALGPSS
jgi:hypothetical protein